MLKLLSLALMSSAGPVPSALPCVPVAIDRLAPTSSAVGDHKALREVLGEPMPDAPALVMLHGRGGHMATKEYSIIVARGSDGVWHGTAVGRSRIGVEDAPYTPMVRKTWVLDKDKAGELEAAIARRCPIDRSVARPLDSGPPPLGYLSERIDVVQAGRPTVSYDAADGDGIIAALTRPPR